MDLNPNQALWQTTATETTLVDGVALPTVTTIYHDLGDWIESVVESGADGTRTTTYTQANLDDGLPYYSKIESSGGPDPYTTTFSSLGQITSYVSGGQEIDYNYSGATVTTTEKMGSSVTKTSVTTYSNGLARASTTVSGVSDGVPALVEYTPGADTTLPWALKTVRGSDGGLATYEYAWDGDNLVTTEKAGGGATASSEVVTAGQKMISKINKAGQLYSSETFDLESGIKLDYATASEYQAGTLFPTVFARPLGTTESYAYDGQGRVTSYTDRLGKTSSYTRDAVGRITQVQRDGLTWSATYNPGFLGQTVTCGARSWTEQTSPFGQTTGITEAGGPEEVAVTRTENTTSVTVDAVNSTTGKTSHTVTQKGTLATAVTGNATEPWNVSYTFPGSGWKETVTHASAGGLSTATTYDALGRVAQVTSPNPAGSGVTTTNFTQDAANRRVTATDSAGATLYEYRADGALQKVSQGGRFLNVGRTAAGSAITWQVTNAAGETLWKQVYDAATQKTEDYPWNQSAQKVTSQPGVTGDTVSLAVSGSEGSGTVSWKDGAPYAGTLTAGAASASWNATANSFGEVTSLTTTQGSEDDEFFRVGAAYRGDRRGGAGGEHDQQ